MLSLNFFTPADTLSLFKQKTLSWADNFPIAVVLDSNNFANDPHARYELLVGLSRGKTSQKLLSAYLQAGENDTFAALHRLSLQEAGQWIFGFLTYDLKNELEYLHSANPDKVGFPSAFFFVPDIVIAVEKNGQSQIMAAADPDNPNFSLSDIEAIKHQIEQHSLLEVGQLPAGNCHFQSRMSRQHYLNCVEALQQHLAKGDIYEVNFCQEFYAENVSLTAYAPLFHQLCRTTQAPFSSYIKLYGQHYLFCASPERFMQKQGHTLRSQPIKGTIRRGQTPQEDEQLRRELQQNPKEQAENVMIVDLVRNDLARCAERKSVVVEELFGPYTFRTVHHLISTVKATLKAGLHWSDALKVAFPMGSMTGAPKVRAMQLIEQYECSKRGLFSGSVGYVTPSGDFDFNVIIRSLLYNAQTKYLSLQTGSAITIYANAEQEYEECLLKAAALKNLLNDK